MYRAPAGKDATQSGFTLIELLVTILIVAILSQIATLEMRSYQRRAHDAGAETAIRGVMTAEEAYYTDNSNYLACADGSCQTTLSGVLLDPGVTVTVTTRDDNQVYDVTGRHPRGASQFSYSSDSGRLTSVGFAS